MTRRQASLNPKAVAPFPAQCGPMELEPDRIWLAKVQSRELMNSLDQISDFRKCWRDQPVTRW